MAVKLRLARFGCKHRPFYRLTAADSNSPRDGKHLEVLGFYNPLVGEDDEKRMSLKSERVKYWLSVGAQPTDSVRSLLFTAGLLPPTPVGRKGGAQDSREVDPMTGLATSYDWAGNV